MKPNLMPILYIGENENDFSYLELVNCPFYIFIYKDANNVKCGKLADAHGIYELTNIQFTNNKLWFQRIKLRSLKADKTYLVVFDQQEFFKSNDSPYPQKPTRFIVKSVFDINIKTSE